MGVFLSQKKLVLIQSTCFNLMMVKLALFKSLFFTATCKRMQKNCQRLHSALFVPCSTLDTTP